MTIHCIVITNIQGVLLLSRYYRGGSEVWDEDGETRRAAFESKLWGLGSPWGVSSIIDGVGMIGHRIVVFRTYGEFVIFVSGDDDYDEV
jgi:hypothetical protein